MSTIKQMIIESLLSETTPNINFSDISPEARSFATGLIKKKKNNIESGTYAVSAYITEVESEDSETGKTFTYFEVTVRGMKKMSKGWFKDQSATFEYVGKMKPKEHFVIAGSGVKALPANSWNAPDLV